MKLASSTEKRIIALIVEVLLPIVCMMVAYAGINDRIRFPETTVAVLRLSTPVSALESAQSVYPKNWVKHLKEFEHHYDNDYAYTWNDREYNFSNTTKDRPINPELVRFKEGDPEQREVGSRPPLWWPLFASLGYVYYFADHRTRFRLFRWANESHS